MLLFSAEARNLVYSIYLFFRCRISSSAVFLQCYRRPVTLTEIVNWNHKAYFVARVLTALRQIGEVGSFCLNLFLSRLYISAWKISTVVSSQRLFQKYWDLLSALYQPEVVGDVEPERLILHPAALTNETQQEHEKCDTVPSYSLVNYLRLLLTF